jgi:hypothetical protein
MVSMETYNGDWATCEHTKETGLHGNIQWRLGCMETYNGDWVAWETAVATGLHVSKPRRVIYMAKQTETGLHENIEW